MYINVNKQANKQMHFLYFTPTYITELQTLHCGHILCIQYYLLLYFQACLNLFFFPTDPNVTKAQTRPRMLTWSTNWRKQTFRPSRKTTKKTTTLKPTTKQLTSTTSQSPTTVHRSTTHSPRKLEVRTSKEPIPIKPALWNETVNAAASRPEPTSKVNVTVSYKPKKHTAKKNLPPDFACKHLF